MEDAGDVDLADDEHEESAASSALKGVKSRRLTDEDDEVEIAASGRAAPKPWGPLPAIILFPAFIITLLGGLMGFELIHTMMGYQQAQKPAAPLVRGIAEHLRHGPQGPVGHTSVNDEAAGIPAASFVTRVNSSQPPYASSSSNCLLKSC